MNIPAILDPSSAMRAIYDLWILWGISWIIAAPFAARAAKRSPWTAVPIVLVAGVLFFFRGRFGVPDITPIWQTPETARWALAAVVAVGIAFAWWARITLGRLWSGTITLKPGHKIIDTGPYALVRHPIYTGLLLAAYATAIAQGSAYAFAVAAAVTVAFVVKAWAEERFLSRELGAEAYDDYRRRVPMLVPFAPR